MIRRGALFLLAAIALTFESSGAESVVGQHTPATVNKHSDSLAGKDIAIRGVFAVIGGGMTVVEDNAAYETIGVCCGLPFGKFIPLNRGDQFWNVREQYEGAHVVVRGRWRSDYCANIEGRRRCAEHIPALDVRDIAIEPTQKRASAREILGDLEEIAVNSPEQPPLRKLALALVDRIAHRDVTGLTALFAPELDPDYTPESFLNEFGRDRISTSGRLTELYKDLMSQTNGRGRWLYFSKMAPTLNARSFPEYRLFIEFNPPTGLKEAVVCYDRQNAASARWPKSIEALQTAKSTDPYVCYYLIKVQHRWWLNFERSYMAGGRYPAVE